MKLSIIIVSWNVSQLLRECLRSVFENRPRCELEVFVVDNHSSDQPELAVRGFAVTYLPQPRNTGFAAANNVALRRATGDYVLLLNPDTRIHAGSIDALVSFAERTPRAGIIGPKLLNPGGSVQQSVRRLPSTAALVMVFLKLHHLFPRVNLVSAFLQNDFDYGRDQKVEQVMGACFLLRRSVIQKIGFLDEGFFIWFEEVDYCARALRAGFEVWYTQQASVTHYFAQSFKQQFSPVKQWRFCKSALRYARLHLGMLSWVTLCLLTPASLLMSLFQLFSPGYVQKSR